MTQVARVYAQALYSLAKDENCSEQVLNELTVLEESFSAEPDFQRLLSAANIPLEERCGILDNSFREKVHPYVLNFMKILTERGYIRHFGDCIKAFRETFNADNGILEVRAVTAIALNPEQTQKLVEKLQKITGKTVKLHNQVDETCIGGVRLDYDGRQLDDTVSHRLDSVRVLLKNTVL